MRFFLISAGIVAIASVSVTPGAISAQGAPASDPAVVVNIGGIYALPTGDFRGQIDRAHGLTVGARAPVSHQGRFSIRLDMSALTYGREMNEVCMRPGAGCRVEASEITTNDILTVGVGPELAFGRGWVQPFAHGFGGFSVYVTQSGLSRAGAAIPYVGFATTTNHSDVAFTWGGGGGVRLHLPVAARAVQLSVGARYQSTGMVEYLRKGDIVDLPDGSIHKELQRGRTDLLSFTVGGAVGVTMPWDGRESR